LDIGFKSAYAEASFVAGHVGVGLGLIALGFVAMSLVKGSPAHRLAGRLFVAAMMGMAATGAVLIVVAPPRAMLTAWAAIPGFYFALTGWLAARRQPPGAGASEIAGAALAGFMALSGVVLALTARHARLEVLYTGAAIASVFAAADLAIAVRGGLAREQRIRRHLWRIGLSVVIATAAIFAAKTQRFPAELRPYLPLLVLPPIAFTLYYAVRYRARREPQPLPRPATESASPG
jgi:hypothetical protein